MVHLPYTLKCSILKTIKESENEQLKHTLELTGMNMKKNSLLAYGLKLEENNSIETSVSPWVIY